MTTTILDVAGVSKRFGGIQAIEDISLRVEAGTIHSIIGPNGAGKTSLFNCITRVYTPDCGTIRSGEYNLLTTGAHRIPAAGIARTFQNLQLYPHLTVLENILTGSDFRDDVSLGEHLFRLPRARRSEALHRAEAARLLDDFGMAAVADLPVSDLPYGAQKMIELARALAMRPRLLLLDEPTAGLNSDEIDKLRDRLRRIHREAGVTMLIIAHDVGFVMQLSDRITVLDFGKVIAEGTPQEIMHDPAVQAAYLGQEVEHA